MEDLELMIAASTITAQTAIQLAKMGGLKVVAVADVEKHGKRLEALGAGTHRSNELVCSWLTVQRQSDRSARFRESCLSDT